MSKKVLFVASEATPFISTGGLAEVIGSLSTSLVELGDDVKVVVPLYAKVNKEWREKMKYLGYIYTDLSWRHEYCGIYCIEKGGVSYYFLDNERYFKREGCYGYGDDGERFAFFSKAALDLCDFLGWYPDILHAHDWQAALSVIYLKTNYCYRNQYKNVKTMFTIHNIEYQGYFGMNLLCDTFDIFGIFKDVVEYNGSINLMKGAIMLSDKFSTVSEKYAEEIKTAEYAHGLDPVVRMNEGKLVGILNGIDTVGYSGEADTHIWQNFTSDNLEGKKVNKQELQKYLNLPVKENTPIISMITRLVSHKGLDLVTCVLEEILQQDVQVVILGTGDKYYEDYFKALAGRYPEKLSANIIFNNDLSRKIYSGSDIFLMPSKAEPCGLSQMICSRYATVPVVRETGGLYDSIKPTVNGYTFANFNAHDMKYVIEQAIADYHNKDVWNPLMKRVMDTDFTWTASAKRYDEVYNDILK